MPNEQPLVFAIDIDGVLAQFALHYARLLITVSGKDRFPEDWRREPDLLTPVWDWEYHWGYTKADRDKAWERIEAKGSRFWLDLPSMPLAKDTIYCLNNLQRYHGHTVYFLTHRPGYHAKLQTERWLYEHGVAYPTVLIVDAKLKPLALSALQADVFIDDKIETVRAAVGRVKRVYLKDAPYNQVTALDEKHSSYVRVKTVQDMLKAEGLWEPHPAREAMFWRKYGG